MVRTKFKSTKLAAKITTSKKKERVLTALFLGAGFSKWAFELPLVNQLFDFNINITNEPELRKVELLQSDWENWKKNSGELSPEQFIYWSLNKSSHRRSRVIWYISRRLTEPFMTRILGSYASAMFDERAVREDENIVEIRKFLLSLSQHGLKGILTCNYDTLVECALGTSGFNYGVVGEQLYGRGLNPQFPWQNAHVSVTGQIPLAKLHGSLSWDLNAKYTSGRPGRAGKALIVPPAPEKTPPPELENVWLLGKRILESSDKIILFGFAFNPYDKALLDFLKHSGKNSSHILLIDPYPNINAAKALWPHANVNTIDPREPFDVREHLLSK